MNPARQNNHSQKLLVPKWASQYGMSDEAAYAFDMFACRGIFGLNILNVSDIERLKELVLVLNANGESLPKGIFKAILQSEYNYPKDSADYCADCFDDIKAQIHS